MKPDKGLAYLTIGGLARHAACRVETVRYYQQAGLMPDPPRTKCGHRAYSAGHRSV